MADEKETPTPTLPAQPELEYRPLSKLAQIAMRQLNAQTQAALEEILAAAADAQGIDAAAGWGFDMRSQSFARQKPVA